MKEKKAREIAEKILAGLPNAGRPGERFIHRSPYNAATGKSYRGSNRFWLSLAGGGAFVGYRQAQKLGWQVKKGAKGVPVCYHGEIETENEGKKTFVKWGTVFPIAMVETQGGSPPLAPPPPNGDLNTLVSSVNVKIVWGKGKAAYVPSEDVIWMPAPECFASKEEMWATLIHELAHWTGSPVRLNRTWDYRDPLGRAMEEVVAEMAAAIVCAELGIDGLLRDHTDYVASWANSITPEMMLEAIQQAKEAAEFLMGLGEQNTQDSHAHEDEDE